MRLLKYPLFLMSFLLLACSQFQTVKHPQLVVTKALDPAVELGIKSDNLKEMVEKAKTLGGNASEFLASDLFIKGNDASMRGDYQTAAQVFKYIVELKPQDSFLKRKLSIELIRIGELKEAEGILETVFKESHYKDDSIGLILAGVYAALERPILARETYQKIINTSNDVEEACLFLAKSYAGEKKFREAHALLSKCENKNKEDPVYAFYRGKIEYDRGNKIEAKRFFQKSLKMDHSYAQAALALGAFYEEKEDFKLAVKTYKDFLAEEGNGQCVPVLSRLVTVLFSLEENAEVMPYAETLSSIDNSDLNLKVRLGLLYSDAGRFDEATNLFKEVLVVVPDSDKVIYYLGALNQQTNHIPEAIEFFKRIPNSSVLYGDAGVQIGQMLSGIAREEFFQIKKEGEASAKLMSYIEQKHGEHEDSAVEIKMIQAGYYEDIYQYKKAIGAMNEVRAHKNFTESHSYYLASLMEKDGQVPEARKLVEAIIEKDPNNAHALNFLGYSYLEKNERLDLAFEYISKAVKLRPEDGYIRDSLAWYYFQTGKLQSALAEAKKAFELVKSDVIITKHLGMIYQRLKDYEKARVYLSQALTQAKVAAEKEDVLKLLNDIDRARLPASAAK
ncbi:MAG: tetratricopeptide repeat protein [Bacteriovorax sp.]|nr:tetratricopeptide repeat protein [Bacteriovorax sp.]